jgi:hypothetical protein
MVDQEHVRDSNDQRRGCGSTHPYGHDEVEQASLRERQTNVAGACQDNFRRFTSRCALRHIIELSMTANDLEASKISGIQSEAIREQLFLAYPALLF